MASRNNCAIKFAYDHSRRVCSSEVLATFPFGEFIFDKKERRDETFERTRLQESWRTVEPVIRSIGFY